jgi:hypothetical protein
MNVVPNRSFTSERAAARLRRVIVADLTLRFGETRLFAQVLWPPAADSLTLLLADRLADAELLSLAAETVVVALTRREPVELELGALRWVADHAGELNRMSRLLLLAGGARAACLAVLARDTAWPALGRQVLIHPRFTSECPMPIALRGLAPAAVLTGSSDDGAVYAELLHAAGVDVAQLSGFTDLLPILR